MFLVDAFIQRDLQRGDKYINNTYYNYIIIIINNKRK